MISTDVEFVDKIRRTVVMHTEISSKSLISEHPPDAEVE